jgi:hypothetical protein
VDEKKTVGEKTDEEKDEFEKSPFKSKKFIFTFWADFWWKVVIFLVDRFLRLAKINASLGVATPVSNHDVLKQGQKEGKVPTSSSDTSEESIMVDVSDFGEPFEDEGDED